MYMHLYLKVKLISYIDKLLSIYVKLIHEMWNN